VFDGSRTTFTPYDKVLFANQGYSVGSGNLARFINNEIDSLARFILSVGGIIQEPDPSNNRGFNTNQIGGGGNNKAADPITIAFVEAPKVTDSFFGYAVKSTNSPTNINQFGTVTDSIVYSIIFGV
jgi:hypothetical protein